MIGLLFGYLFLFYGIYKFIICYLDISLTYQQKEHLLANTTWFKHVLTMDVSVAGRTLSIIYIVFALITIFRSIERIKSGTIYTDVVDILNERLFIYIIYGLLGALLVVMYVLVVYTKVSIHKDDKYQQRYKLAGICGGLIFVASVPIMILLHKIFDHGFRYAIRHNVIMTLFSIVSTTLTIGIIGRIGYNMLTHNHNHNCRKKSVALHEYISLFIIPTNVI